MRISAGLSVLLLTAGLGACVSEPESLLTQQIAAGAAYTTFDEVQGGCLDSPNGVNCNHYVSKWDVYASGGPPKAGLSDGDYFFAVLTPGSQNGGFIDGANGNLSDRSVGGTVGDLGSGDAVENRTFHVMNHDISSYNGTHRHGVSPQGHPIIQLMVYDNTDNPGGVYILAVCSAGALSPKECKFDAFKIRPSCGDGALQEGEECDDGNHTDGDGCSANCTVERPHVEEPVCGNGKLELGEACDDGNHADGDGCSANCTIEVPVCGNGKLEGNEACDDGNYADGDGCSANCTIEVPVCGNGRVEAGEECDDGNCDNGDGCSSECKVEC
jgi:cysteine-rich repeat protein